ncbi:hypothetical protein FTX61_20515 [Nitriliruptoraceae bacterium ZYF776]|nr:hypothetical protein [Profundirhabdus halotolerans]
MLLEATRAASYLTGADGPRRAAGTLGGTRFSRASAASGARELLSRWRHPGASRGASRHADGAGPGGPAPRVVPGVAVAQACSSRRDGCSQRSPT